MATYEVDVKLPNGYTQRIRVQATSDFNAKAQVEAQYGKGSIRSHIMKVSN